MASSTNNIKVVCRWVVWQHSFRVSAPLDNAYTALLDCSCRFRPQNALEIREGGEVVVAFDDNLQTVKLRTAVAEKDGFTFDRMFAMETKQHEVFDYGISGLVRCCARTLESSC